MEGYEFLKTEMRRTLENLAADATEQRRYLKGLGVSPLADELALEFDDIASRLDLAIQEHLVSPETASAVHSLNRTLRAMSGDANARLWSIDGLQSAEWDIVRRQARAALERWVADQKDRGSLDND
jgi:hypothetical protein